MKDFETLNISSFIFDCFLNNDSKNCLVTCSLPGWYYGIKTL